MGNLEGTRSGVGGGGDSLSVACRLDILQELMSREATGGDERREDINEESPVGERNVELNVVFFALALVRCDVKGWSLTRRHAGTLQLQRGALGTSLMRGHLHRAPIHE